MKPVAFLSYVHLDDAGAAKELSLFHDKLQQELRIHTGLPVHIFFDKKSIGWGKRWAEFIDHSLENAAFLIPILTPAFFQSHSCKDEYTKFANSEKAIGRRDLILPIYYVKCREMTAKSGIDPVVDDILSRQYRDWTALRYKPLESVEILKEFAGLASAMAETFFEISEAAKLSTTSSADKVGKDLRTLDYQDQLLDREINYENLVSYTVEMFPQLPVSREWTREMLSDMSRDRYKHIRDVDREVKYAKTKLEEYAKKRPELFRFGTDYITKSLIFVDSDFRERHDISPETLKAAADAGITRY